MGKNIVKGIIFKNIEQQVWINAPYLNNSREAMVEEYAQNFK